MLVEINPQHPEPRKIRRAVEALEAGEVIAYPTDTCYGLGCDLFNKKAVDRLYQIKGTDRSQMLAFVCQSLTDISKYAVMHDRVYRILKTYLPGPYCFVLEATREVPRLIQSPRRTVGIRIPRHPVALAIAAELGRPIISSTAARHGESPNPDPREVEQEFGGLALVLDAGAGGTVPTTVVDLTGPLPRLIRAGAGDTTPFDNQD
ncbi:MAG TPA: L-threonylcarbamoyladenylate synthase [Polyangiaceae bacterium]|nr:L-threonylcarbamoyladenylate synthase [Polyangiaceae bacterium]